MSEKSLVIVDHVFTQDERDLLLRHASERITALTGAVAFERRQPTHCRDLRYIQECSDALTLYQSIAHKLREVSNE